MQAKTNDLLWTAAELPPRCYYRALTSKVGVESLQGLPIEEHRASIEAAVKGHQVTGIKSPTASGKTTQVPTFMREVLVRPPGQRQWHPAVVVVEHAIIAAEKVVDDLVNVFGVDRSVIHLRTGQHDRDRFVAGETRLSVITYGILWRWLTGIETDRDRSPIRRYAGIFLDEFADLKPKQEEMAHILGGMLRTKELPIETRLVLASSALRLEEVEQLFGANCGFVLITSRSIFFSYLTIYLCACIMLRARAHGARS